MVSGGDDTKAQYLRRLTTAVNAFSRRIEERVPGDLIIKGRFSLGFEEIKPGEPSYSYVRQKFINDVCSNASVEILQFLYVYHVDTGTSWEIFYNTYKNYLSPESITRLKFDFPKIDQTTVAKIVHGVSDTAVSYRLEDLERIGLIQRSALGPPRPKYVAITDAGISVVESAVREGMEALKPLFNSVRPGQFSEMSDEDQNQNRKAGKGHYHA